jgi:hypothetical protein
LEVYACSVGSLPEVIDEKLRPARAPGIFTVLCLFTGACANDEPSTTTSPVESPTETPELTLSPEPASPLPTGVPPLPTRPPTSPSPASDPLNLAQGTAQGLAWKLVLKPGNPVCLELQAGPGSAGSIVCDEESEQDFNGDQRLRFSLGGVNESEVPRFAFGFTVPEVTRVRVELASGAAPEETTKSSSAVPNRRFFVVPLLGSDIAAVRGLNQAGVTVAGFSYGSQGPSPFPTG